MKKTISTLFLSIVVFALHAQGFVHPGLLHTKQSLERMKAYVASKEEPAYAAFNSLAED